MYPFNHCLLRLEHVVAAVVAREHALAAALARHRPHRPGELRGRASNARTQSAGPLQLSASGDGDLWMV